MEPLAFLVWTDGSCWTGDRIGAYAYCVLDEEGVEHTGGKAEYDTTISRMELMGPISALETIFFMCDSSIIQVFSDSEYVVKGITDRTRQRNKNIDLWQMLDWLVDQHEHVEFEHVKGHAGDHYNELVDDLAGKLRKEAQNVE